jgi:UDP-glucose 4-epimerase
MTVLVTGGAGYIGSHTVRALIERGHDVVVLDTLELGDRARVPDAAFVRADVADGRAVERAVRRHGVTEAIHFAAYKAVGESMEQPLRYWSNNVAGSVALVRALLASGVTRMVFSSSAAVYGTPDLVPVTEDAPMRPESVYAETKVAVERMLAACDAVGLRSVSLRYFNAAGASDDASIGEDWDASQNLVPRVMKAIVTGEPMQVFGDDYPTSDGTCVRDYIHVLDLADAHVAALGHLASGGASAACNVGTGLGTSVAQVIDLAEQVSGRRVPRTVGPRRPGDPSTVYADPTMARTLLGWTARRDLRDIVASAWRWHSSAR